MPGRPTNLDYDRARAYCACSKCGWGLSGHFFSRLSFLFSHSLSVGDGPIWTEILSQRAVKPKKTQKNNHINVKVPDPTIRGQEFLVTYNMVLFTNKDYFRSEMVGWLFWV